MHSICGQFLLNYFFCRCGFFSDWNSVFTLFLNIVDNLLKMLGWESLADVEGVSCINKSPAMTLHHFLTA